MLYVYCRYPMLYKIPLEQLKSQRHDLALQVWVFPFKMVKTTFFSWREGDTGQDLPVGAPLTDIVKQ